MSQPNYKVILQLANGNEYEFEQRTQLQWERYENIPGRCKFAIPHNDPKISNISDDSQFIQIFIYRNTSLVWQGFVAYLEDTENQTTIYGLGLLECLKWYRVGYDTEYSSKKIGTEILEPIWNSAAGRSDSILGDVIDKGSFQDPYDSGTSTPKTITRKVFDEDYYTLCQEMIYLSRADSPSGSWTQNAVMEVTLSKTSPTFNFKRDVGSDKTQKIFELDSEISTFTQSKDFRFIRNDIKGLTVAEGPEVLNATETDATSQSNYYLREISKVFARTTTQSELNEATKDELAENKTPQREFYVTFSSGVKPFDGYSMGDNIKIRINRGRIDVDTFFRVVGMEVNVTNEGVELARPILQRKRI